MIHQHFQSPWVAPFDESVKAELSVTKNDPPFTSFQLATIDSETGYPQNRTLVYRGWLFDNKDSSVLTFATDKRMSKYKELLHNDKCEAVFYFSRIKKQFRLRARARVIDEQNPPLDLINVLNQEEETERQISTDITQELNRQWSNLSKSLKKSFKKPPPKSVMSDENAKLISSIHRGVDGKNIDYGLKNFALVGLFIDYVDYYDLEKDKRFIYQLDENHQWFEQEVCP
ncbi:hypothetical protein MEM_05258 [Candida albicans L26]|uniref:Uncharacterized protein CaJ7.0368 n=1 Tax=Candida albicans TaxID=5476 RepID=G1UA74_CANAX|nr:hypothetical protein MEK_05250 [Candida albicans 12C]KGU03828.1 hypothetical protein MEM_05258 [Candida albicans L26]BAE44824.1 hypothetical protein [Candida albicans]